MVQATRGVTTVSTVIKASAPPSVEAPSTGSSMATRRGCMTMATMQEMAVIRATQTMDDMRRVAGVADEIAFLDSLVADATQAGPGADPMMLGSLLTRSFLRTCPMASHNLRFVTRRSYL